MTAHEMDVAGWACIILALTVWIAVAIGRAHRDAQLRRAVQTQLARNGYATRTRRARSSRFGA